MNQKLTPTVIGIDIGASSAKLAAVQRGAIDVITNQANFRETPSIVGYGEGQRKIGQLGSVKLKSNFKNTVISPHRYLGLNGSDKAVEQLVNNCPCTTKFEGDKLYFKVNAGGKDENLTSQQILASFMTQLSFIIQHNNLDGKLIAFSVPSFFTQIERKALLNAAEISGLKNVKLVNESIAIGLDYGVFKKSQMGEGKNVAFLDFGHSNLTATLIKFTQSKMEIILQKYNRNIGCRNLDQKIFEYMAKKFQQKTQLNIRQSKKACLKLLEAIQKQRKILSGISQTQIVIECLFEDEDLSEHFTRQILYKQAGEVFNQISNLLTSFKQQVSKAGEKIDSIELVGGGSRIPNFIYIAEQIFGMPTSRTTNSSQTIARGAALFAVQNSGLFRFDTYHAIDKSAHQISLSWKQSTGQQQPDFTGQNQQKIIEYSDKIPLEKQIKIETNKKVQILVSYNKLQEQLEKKILRISCEPSNDEINIKFKVSEDELVSVESIKDKSGQNIKHTIKLIKELTPEEMLSFKAKQRQMHVKDFAILQSYEKKNELESFVYKQREIINNQQFNKYLSAEQKATVESFLSQITTKLQSQDNKMGIKDYQKKMDEIQGEIKKLSEKAKKRKSEIFVYFKQLEKLKSYATDTMKQIAQKFRNSKPVAETYEQIKEISEWAQEAIKLSKTKNVNELPVVSNKDIEQQYENIKTLVDNLVNPPRPKAQPRHQHFQQRYDPNDFMRRSWFGPQQFYQQQDEQAQQARRLQQQRLQQQKLQQQKQQQQRMQQQRMQQERRRQQQAEYYEAQRRQQEQQRRLQEQQRRKQQQRYHDPYGMSRSGYFGPNNNFFGGFF